MQSVTVIPTAAEHQAATRAVISRLSTTAGTTVARIGALVAGPLVLFGLVALSRAEYPISANSNIAVPTTLAILIAGVVLYFVSIAVSKRQIERSLYAPGSKLLRPYTLELLPHALLIQSAGSRAEVEWSSIEHVEELHDGAVIFTAPIHALSLPARCFSTPQEYSSFLAALRSHAHAREV